MFHPKHVPYLQYFKRYALNSFKKWLTTIQNRDVEEQYMKQTRKKLPVDLASFEKMRTENYLYVDKTQHIYRMATEGTFYFLARPRRFGKSLLVSTLTSLFRGRKELFDGL